MARASPSCAMIANSLACALLSAASVATSAMVVFSPGRPFAFGVRAADGTVTGKPRPPNSPSTSNGAAQKCGPPPTLTLPQALTATSAPTVGPSRVTAEAEPSRPLSLTVVAPKPAPAVPGANDLAAGAAGAVPRAG